MTRIDCPVCDRPAVDAEACPNCEADLSALHLLARLPKASTAVPTAQPAIAPSRRRVSAVVAIALLAAGGLAGTSGYLLGARRVDAPRAQQAIAPSVPAPAAEAPVVSEASAPAAPAVDGFRYHVRPGDSLWLIARRFYGSGDRWNALKRERTGTLRPGEILTVPNLTPPEAR